jgi:stage III sporulation protein SpoIIIAA
MEPASCGSSRRGNSIRFRIRRTEVIVPGATGEIVGGNIKLVRLRLSNFRSFSADYTELDLDDLTFLLGPNGAGKTAVLQALARMFSLDPVQRKVKKSDFHVPHDEKPEQTPAERELWIEADF